MKESMLALVLIGFAINNANAVSSPYARFCKHTDAYDGGKRPNPPLTGDATCDQYFSQLAQSWKYGPAFVASITSGTCDLTKGWDFSSSKPCTAGINCTIGYQLEWSGLLWDCCTDGVTACGRPYGGLCQDPSAYNGDHILQGYNTPGYQTCNDLAFTVFREKGYPFLTSLTNGTCDANKGWNEREQKPCVATDPDCKDFGYQLLYGLLFSECCTDGLTECGRPFEKLCKHPSAYNGTRPFEMPSNPMNPTTCDDTFAQLVNSGSGLVTAITNGSCDVNSGWTQSNISKPCDAAGPGCISDQYYEMMFSGCCTDGVTACGRPYAKMCKHPSAYNGATIIKFPPFWGNGTYMGTCDQLFGGFLAYGARIGKGGGSAFISSVTDGTCDPAKGWNFKDNEPCSVEGPNCQMDYIRTFLQHFDGCCTDGLTECGAAPLTNESGGTKAVPDSAHGENAYAGIAELVASIANTGPLRVGSIAGKP